MGAVKRINGGLTCAQITATLPTDEAIINEKDATLVVCMLNGIAQHGNHFPKHQQMQPTYTIHLAK